MSAASRRGARLAIATAGVVALLAGLWWWEARPPTELLEAEVELASLADLARMTTVVEAARAMLLDRQEPSDPALGDALNRQLFLCAHGVGDTPCGEGTGATWREALRAAAADLQARHGQDWAPDPQRLHVSVDVVQYRESAWWPDDELRRAAGVDGLWVDGGGFVLPSEVITRGLTPGEDGRRFDPDRLVSLLRARGAGVTVTGFGFERLRTSAWVETVPGGSVMRTYRAHGYAPPDSDDPEVVLQAAVWAADHLAASVAADGQIRYLFDPVQSERPAGYNRLRHAGTTYSLIQAWDRVRTPEWRAAAEQAIRWLLTQSRRDVRQGPYGGGEGQYIVEGSHIKLGGAGLALVMLSTWQSATGDASYAEDAKRFATFLVSQQQQSGEFVYFPNRFAGGPPRDDTSAYYPGEAILGLALWHRIDPDRRWIESAVRGADWLIEVRDAGKGPSRLANDHWLLIALSHLYTQTRDPKYLAHSLAIAEAVEWQAARTAASVPRYRDYEGGYYDPPRSTPASTRAEGLVAVLDTCAAAGDLCDGVGPRLGLTLGHILTQQYTPRDLWWIDRPAVVLGGVAGGVTDPMIRNDYVQHALSAMLGAERHLRSDRRVPGGPAWPPGLSRDFPGIAAPVRRSLRADSEALQGLGVWRGEPASAPDQERQPAQSSPSQ